MLLVAIGAGIVLALAVGGPPAHADEVTPDEGSPRSVVGVLAGGLTSATERPTGTPITAPFENPQLAPVGRLLDDTGDGGAEVVGLVPVLLQPVEAVLDTGLAHPLITVAAVSWSIATTAATTSGQLLAVLEPTGLPDGSGGLPAEGSSPGSGSAGSSVSTTLVAGMLGAAFVMLLASARRRIPDDAIPASLVFDNDSSPD